MLELRGLRKQLGSWSLTGLDLALEPGEYFMLLGPSGVGKSVTLELISGLQRPDGGSVWWKGQDVTGDPPEDRPFSIVYQDCALFPHLSVSANIAYGPKVSGVRKSEAERRVTELAELLRITDLLDRQVVSLSGGEEQRVALARALATRPELLLLDEPLSALDAAIREYLRGELSRLHRDSGATFLHVTHAQQEARHLADRVGVMLDGRLVQVATPRELFREPSNVEVSEFLGLRNVFPVQSTEAGRAEVAGVGLVGDPLSPKHDHVWIRPEEIALHAEATDAPNVWKGRIQRVEDVDTFATVHVVIGELELQALLTDAQLRALGKEAGDRVYVTFGDAALHGL